MSPTLRKSEILRGYRSFSAVISRGIQISSRPVRMYYLLEDASEERTRFGFAVSRSVRSAARRNRAKRCLREGVRLHKEKLLAVLEKSNRAMTAVLLYTPPQGDETRRSRFEGVETPVREIFDRLSRSIEAQK